MCRVIDQPDIFSDVRGWPTTFHQLGTGLSGVSRRANGRDDLVNIADCDGQTAEDMAALSCFAQFKRCAACHDLFAECDEVGQEGAQGQLFRPSAVQGEHVRAERRLHRCKAEQLIQNDFSCCVTLQLDHDAHTDPVGFVLHVRNALDLLLAGQFGDLLDHRSFVHLIRDLINDDGVAIFADLFYACLCSDDDRAATFKIGFTRTRAAQNHPASREVRSRDIFDQLFGRQIGIFDQRQSGITDLAQIMGRDTRGHTNRDTL